METPDTQPPLDDYEANERDEIAETEADVKRHRVMKGHPPKEIFSHVDPKKRVPNASRN
ncbi:MAG TPA: hypothetical protein VIU12_28345 [Chryseolinea sp.]